MGDADDLYYADADLAESLAIEQRLRDNGFANLLDVLTLGGDHDYDGTTVEEIVAEAAIWLQHHESVDLAGARILGGLGSVAAKVQAFDAIAALVRRTSSSAAGRRD
jgi:hypothetical protein